MPFSFFDDVSTQGPLRIMTLCTGNICRSPLAESLLRKELAGLPVELSSAGTHALVGQSMPAQTQELADEYGVVETAEHRAKQITQAEIRSADLVLALDREHRRQVAELLPRASRYTFTLREFARLASNVSEQDLVVPAGKPVVEHLHNAIEAVAQLRGSLPLLDNPLDDDVVDPYRQSDEIYRQSADQLVPAVKAVACLLHRAASEVN